MALPLFLVFKGFAVLTAVVSSGAYIMEKIIHTPPQETAKAKFKELLEEAEKAKQPKEINPFPFAKLKSLLEEQRKNPISFEIGEGTLQIPPLTSWEETWRDFASKGEQIKIEREYLEGKDLSQKKTFF